ncbi:AAA family ATPase [Mesorhizobium amorphae]|uniref:AAA family ATPase n=1 Tax=Mesorhizobium amorphae TaxID=71433 RepID=UPI00177F831F|nr:AAA family ATPase [Mesorhizobium amorphae]
MIEFSPEEKLRAAGASKQISAPILTPIDGGKAREAGRKRPSRFQRTNTTTIMATVYPAIRWIVPGYISEGLSVLAGRQKLGKTWLAIDWAIAVACGGYAMGSISCEIGDVLYIDMENGHRRIQRRIDTLYPDARNRPDLSRLQWGSDAPMLNDGFLDCLDEWRQSVAKPRLIVIDVLQRVKPAGNSNQNAYESDYSTMAGLQQWATTQGIAVVALHHTKKGGADDPLEALSGSNGLSACADTTLVLDRDQNGITLYVRGRDVEEKESAMKFTAGFWNVTGEAAEVRRSGERGNIAVTLEEATEPMSPSDLADVTGMKNGNIRKLLFGMAKAGEVQKCGRGRYISPKNAAKFADVLPPGNNGNKVTFDGGGDE